MLYSVVFRDYNGDGVLDGEDVAWVGDNNTSRVQNMPAFDGVKPKREYQGLQFVLNKRYSERWQGLASVLISNSDGISRRSFRQDFNVEAPMFYDDNWMGNINYTVNNLEGPLPFTPEVRAEAVGLLQDPQSGSRSRYPLPDAQRAGGVAARGLSVAHRVRGAAGRRDQPGGACRRSSASIPTIRTTCRTSTSSISISRGPSIWVGPGPSTSSSTGSTSSIRPLRSTWTCNSSTDGSRQSRRRADSASACATSSDGRSTAFGFRVMSTCRRFGACRSQLLSSWLSCRGAACACADGRRELMQHRRSHPLPSPGSRVQAIGR